MTVIANDIVPIHPYKTNVLNIAMGQRYDVIVKADQVSVAKTSGYVRFHKMPVRKTQTQPISSGVDEDMSNLTPIVSKIVSRPFYNKSEPVSLGKNGGSLYRWKLNSTSMHVDWTDPTLLEIYRGHHNWANSSGVIELPHKNVWTYIVIETSMSVPHPIHLHGHDFVILAQGSGAYTGDISTLATPPKRDTAMLPENGYLVIAFKTDNPGAWLMHCHIGWHTEEGFAIQFVERYSEIQALVDYDILHYNCEAWDTFQKGLGAQEDDSGI
ncbi:uncharacterized protein N7511_005990 [Penicillium nucicola]|uniref:uncharacterized protein n=1 Tax=Penicillium nucicola TaxID=1850975 RepID=UPI00254577A5|nr:uncharacterized protein N7511_005990 [Penicillium nucicola]KAJ5757296.1 hypothetical protein N7511_005990 [Penicillium nucicola]